MKENKYDDIIFFEKYSKMPRSTDGLVSAGEWNELRKLLPDFNDKRVLDLGCGFGWHCNFAIENGAKAVVGIDISDKMLDVARAKSLSARVEFFCKPIENIDFTANSFDVVISSLALHYIANFGDVAAKVCDCLTDGGHFVFSVEHPIFTSYGSQDWVRDDSGNILHFPVDNYFIEGKRQANFLGENVLKYHKTLTTYLNSLIQSGFEILSIVEPTPSEKMLREIKEMRDELRRPMMLLVSARKKCK